MISHYLAWVFLKGFKTKNPAEAGVCGEDGARTHDLLTASQAL